MWKNLCGKACERMDETVVSLTTNNCVPSISTGLKVEATGLNTSPDPVIHPSYESAL